MKKVFLLLLPLVGWAQSNNTGPVTTMEYDNPDTSTANSTMFTQVTVGWAPYTGVAGTSLTGAQGTFFSLGREDRQGFFRTFFGAGLDLISGQSTFQGDAGPSTLNLTLFKSFAGLHLYFFQNSTFLPFIGGAGLASLGSFEVSGSSVVDAYSRPSVLGYELSMGVDFKNSTDETGHSKPWLRLKLSWAQESGPFATVAGFRMDSFRISVGL